MKIFSKNEYSELKSIIVGRIEHANWPDGDEYFDLMIRSSTYPTKLKKGKINSKIKKKTKKDLDNFIKILQKKKVTVYRPKILNWEKKNKIFNKVCSGMHSYSARDLLLVVGQVEFLLFVLLLFSIVSFISSKSLQKNNTHNICLLIYAY